MKEVKDINITKIEKFSDLIDSFYEGGGFMAKHLAIASKIVEEMIKDKETTKFLAFPACIVATGCRGAINYFIKKKFIDVIITTCGTIDHDIARIISNYYHGHFNADDIELYERGIHRLGNIFIPIENYGIAIENFVKEFIKFLESNWKKDRISTWELIREIGRFLEERDFERREESLIYLAYKNNIPIIIPGITDGSFGYNLWYYYQKGDLKIFVDQFLDENKLNSIIFDSKKTGAIILGGGISKHHTIWWNQFKGGLNYSVYITTAVEWDGSLSGAQTREAISWGKISKESKNITVYGDATILFPLIALYIKEKIG